MMKIIDDRYLFFFPPHFLEMSFSRWKEIEKQVCRQMPQPATLSCSYYGRWNSTARQQVFCQPDLNTGKMVLSGHTETEKLYKGKSTSSSNFGGLSEEQNKKLKRAARAMCCSNQRCPTLQNQITFAMILSLAEDAHLKADDLALKNAMENLPKLKKCELS